MSRAKSSVHNNTKDLSIAHSNRDTIRDNMALIVIALSRRASAPNRNKGIFCPYRPCNKPKWTSLISPLSFKCGFFIHL